MAGVDYSKLAKVYRWLEFCVFGGTLQRARIGLLAEMCSRLEGVSEPNVLLVGDGDGRFCKELLRSLPTVCVDYVDVSPGMLEQAQLNVGGRSQVRWCCEDVRKWKQGGYDLVVAHFVLDGFEEKGRDDLLGILLGCVRPSGSFVMTDFNPAARLWGRAAVFIMQTFFRLCTGARFVQVERDDLAIEKRGGRLPAEKLWRKGWIYTQLWTI